MINKAINNFYFDIDIPIKKEIILRVLSKRLVSDNNNNNNNKMKKKEKKSSNNNGKKIIIIIGLFILFLIIFISSLFKLVNWYKDNQNTNEVSEEIEEIVKVEEIIEEEIIELVNEPEEEPESDYWYYIKFPLIQVDFNELIKKNSDTVAWIQVNNTNINYINPILSIYTEDAIDGMDEYQAYSEIVRENIDMESLVQRYPYEQKDVQEIYDLIVETVVGKGGSMIISGQQYPRELVKSRFLKLNMSHVEYVMECLRKNTTKVYNIKAYLLAALFNAGTTMSNYYRAEVNHDMPQFAG